MAAANSFKSFNVLGAPPISSVILLDTNAVVATVVLATLFAWVVAVVDVLIVPFRSPLKVVADTVVADTDVDETFPWTVRLPDDSLIVTAGLPPEVLLANNTFPLAWSIIG